MAALKAPPTPGRTTHSLSVFVELSVYSSGPLIYCPKRTLWALARLIFTELRSLWPHWMLARTGSSPSRCNQHLHGIYGQCCHLKGPIVSTFLCKSNVNSRWGRHRFTCSRWALSLGFQVINRQEMTYLRSGRYLPQLSRVSGSPGNTAYLKSDSAFTWQLDVIRSTASIGSNFPPNSFECTRQAIVALCRVLVMTFIFSQTADEQWN